MSETKQRNDDPLDPVVMALKPCTCCRDEKPYTEFYSNRRNKDGKMHFCIPCTKKKQAAYREENREKLRQAHKDRYYSDHENNKKKKVVRRQANGEKITAQEKAWREINSARIKPIRRKQGKEEYQRNKIILSNGYIRQTLNRNQPTFLKKALIPEALIEAKRFEILITRQMEATK